MKVFIFIFVSLSATSDSFAQLRITQYLVKADSTELIFDRFHPKGEVDIKLYDHEIQLKTKTSGYGSVSKIYPVKDIKYSVYNKEKARSENVYHCNGELGEMVFRFWMNDEGFLASMQEGSTLVVYSGEVSHYNHTKEARESTFETNESDETLTQSESTITISESDQSNSANSNDGFTEEKIDETFSFGAGKESPTHISEGVGNGSGNAVGSGNYNSGRKVIKPPTFDSKAQQEGSIALDLWVNAKGQVTKTRFKPSKSTSGSAYLIHLAEKAAKTMRYDTKSGAEIEHVGFLIFTFKKI